MFIAIDGIEGCGKTTQTRMLRDYLLEKGHKVVLHETIGGTEVGERIMRFLRDSRNDSMCGETEALLFAAQRMQYQCEVVLPAMREGKILIADRYVSSSYAYQGEFCSFEYIRKINSGITKYPDITIILDDDLDVCMSRMKMDKDRIEQRGRGYFLRVQERFNDLGNFEMFNVHYIDCRGKNIEEKHKEIVEVVEKLLGGDKI